MEQCYEELTQLISSQGRQLRASLEYEVHESLPLRFTQVSHDKGHESSKIVRYQEATKLLPHWLSTLLLWLLLLLHRWHQVAQQH